MYRILKVQDNITASHVYIRDKNIKEELASDMFEFMNTAYKYIGGFKSFTGEDDFIDNSYLWYVTYDGHEETPLDINKVYTVSVFKQKYGLKLVGVGNNRFYDIVDEEERKTKKLMAASALDQQLKWAVKTGWMEVSGGLEKKLKSLVSPKYIIEPEVLEELGIFDDIEILPDNLHYSRILKTGLEVTKIAYGKIRV